jgi:serine/threonine protein kinase
MTASATASDSGMYCPTCEATFEAGDYCPNDNTKLVKLEIEDPLLDRVLDGRYTLVAKLGHGGMGSVYRAAQHSVGRDVAIKLMAPNLVSDKNAIKRFLREAKLASSFSHPNAVGVMDFGQTDDGLFFLVMELVDGISLAEVLDADPVLPLARVVRIATQICDALESAHDHQIVHRDLKPANVMVLAGGRDLVKVLDFGIAKSLIASDTMMTHTGVVIGTPSYMSPEVATGREIDVRADLYSLGCMLYQMMTGMLPFVSTSTHEVMMMQHEQAPAPMFGVPDAYAAVVMRLLEKSRDLRFPSAAATRSALEQAAASRDSTPTLTGSQASRATEIHAAVSAEARIVSRAPAVATPPPQLVIHPRRKPSTVVAIFVVVALASAAAAFLIIKSIGHSESMALVPDAAVAITSAVVIDATVLPSPIDAARVAAAPVDAREAIDAGRMSHHPPPARPGSGSGSGSATEDPPF